MFTVTFEVCINLALFFRLNTLSLDRFAQPLISKAEFETGIFYSNSIYINNFLDAVSLCVSGWNMSVYIYKFPGII